MFSILRLESSISSMLDGINGLVDAAHAADAAQAQEDDFQILFQQALYITSYILYVG